MDKEKLQASGLDLSGSQQRAFEEIALLDVSHILDAIDADALEKRIQRIFLKPASGVDVVVDNERSLNVANALTDVSQAADSEHDKKV